MYVYVYIYISAGSIPEFCSILTLQRWSEYNTNVLEYEYDYFEHTWVQVLRKQMYSSTSTITLQYTRTITLQCNHDYFNEYPISNIKATFMESLGVILVLLLCH